MTDASLAASPHASPAATPVDANSVHMTEAARARLRRRYAADRRFRVLGLSAVLFGIAALGFLLFTILSNGFTAFRQTELRLDIVFSRDIIAPDGKTDPRTIRAADWARVVRESLQARFPEARDRRGSRFVEALVSPGAQGQLMDMVLADPALIGQTRSVWVLAASDIDMIVKGHADRAVPEEARRVNDRQLAWMDALRTDGALRLALNTRFLTGADSRYPELVGIWGGILGSLYTLAITLALAFPLGVMAAIYLEEFAPKNRFTDLIEVNINNLAAVPSIVFGLLGLAVFLNAFGMPRSAPLVGGCVLALMSLPIIIIAARAALRAVPPSIREAALGLGASRLQMVLHHVLPLAMPGILTGTILSMAHALGETAPLLMIGMVAFIVDVPSGPLDAATVLPVQIFMWADSPERGFVEKTSAAILVLLIFLLGMNAVAIWLRKKFERRW
jgi:phosphate transport system permease protein